MKEQSMKIGWRDNRRKRIYWLTLILVFVTLMTKTTSAFTQEDGVVEPASSNTADFSTQIFRPIADTYVDSANPNDSFADADVLNVVRINLGNGSIQQRSYLRFDLSTIRRGAPVQAATLLLFQTTGSINPLQVNRVTADWNAAALSWANQPQFISVDSWAAPGNSGEYIAYSGVPLVELVQSWVNDPARNFGLMLGSGGGAQGDARQFYSVDFAQNLPPLLQIDFAPIRVCYDTDCLKPANDVEVYNRATGNTLSTDEAGYVVHDGEIAVGDQLWAQRLDERLPRALRFLTSGEPQTVTSNSFVLYPGLNRPEMRLVLYKPLLVRDLQVSAQWNLEGDLAYKNDLARRIIDASAHFYRITDGQFALGRVTVHQNYERWHDPNTDLWLHASNTMRPLSYIKGDVITPTVDPAPGIDFVYEPGNMYIGSHWNRYGAPPTQPLPPGVDVSRDWAAALAHELGHYLLGLFDAYIAVQPDGIVIETFACTGSAMGYVYDASNQAFIWDEEHWADACSNTLGAYNVKRTEWQTIRTWFDWAQTPASVVPFTGTLPIDLTNVTFIAPAAPPPLVNQIFDLDYQNDELPSGEARAFLLRDVDNNGVFDRVLDQGRPPQNVAPPQVTLTGAQAGDRLCVIDIDPHADSPETPRHQFGCQVIQPGDSVLPMRREPAWAPIIHITPLTVTETRINVVQPIVAGALRAVLYPEHAATPTAVVELTPGDDGWSGVFTLPGLTPSAFVQVWVEGDDQPLRREAIVDYGIGGGAVPGPKQKIGFAPVTSSDGKAFFLLPAQMSLAADEFVAIQSMAGAPPLPGGMRILGQSYRLIALPPSLVEQGSINIYLGEGSPGLAVQAARTGVMQQDARSIYFWNGESWEKLPTTFSTADHGSGESEVLASAASRGIGVYAILTEASTLIYLPTIAR